MSWCDRLAAVPTVGIFFNWHFISSGAIIDAISPTILSKLVDNDRPQFSIATPDPFSVTINTQSGYSYAIEPAKVSVGFQHNMRAKSTSGGLPVMEMLSTPAIYTQLLQDVCERALDIATSPPFEGSRKVTRIGIVTALKIDDDIAPPGIARLLDYIARPLGSAMSTFAIQVLGNLGTSQDHSDRCFHFITKSDIPGDLLSLTFDWQRTYSNPRQFTKPVLRDNLKRAQEDALRYFEDVAEGVRFDENINSGPTGA